MGICSSCQATSEPTAKLIQQNGDLQEYPHPVKVSRVLETNPSSFICNSDDMEFDDVVEPISDEEVLEPGQLYFALPLTRLKRPIEREEMAALAVKASSALNKSDAPRNCGCGGGKSLVTKPSRRHVIYSGAVAVASKKDKRGSGRGGMLSAIPE